MPKGLCSACECLLHTCYVALLRLPYLKLFVLFVMFKAEDLMQVPGELGMLISMDGFGAAVQGLIGTSRLWRVLCLLSAEEESGCISSRGFVGIHHSRGFVGMQDCWLRAGILPSLFSSFPIHVLDIIQELA